MDWDLFISHASEDKDDVVRPLVELLRSRGLTVWYDEDCIQVGDSIRRSIDRGLLRSRYGVVIVSPHSLEKEWPQKELDALMALENGQDKRVLPVWHNITKADINEASSLLSDRHALSTASGLDAVAEKIHKVVFGTHAGSSPSNPAAGRYEGALVAGLLCDGMVAPGAPCDWRAELLVPPPLEKIPLLRPPSNTITMPDGTSIALPTMDLLGTNAHVNKNFLREVALYEQACRVFRPICVAIENRFSTTARDVLLELVVPKNRACVIKHEYDLPQKPKRTRNPMDVTMAALGLARRSGEVEIEDSESDTVVRFAVDTLQPGRLVTSDSFMMALLESGEFSLEGHMYSSVLPRPASVCLGIRAEIIKKQWTVQDVEAHARSIDTD